jgi:hypothetical protein
MELLGIAAFILFWSAFTAFLIACIPLALILVILLKGYELGENIFKDLEDL